MKKDRLMFFIDRFKDFNGGTERHIRTLLNSLIKHNLFDIHVVTFYHEDCALECLDNKINYASLYRNEAESNIVSLCLDAMKIIRSIKPDIVNTYFIDPYIATGYSKYACKFQWIHHLRNMEYFIDNRFKILDFLIRKRVDRYIVNSEAVRKYLHAKYGVNKKSVDVIYNGLPETYFNQEVVLPEHNKFIVGTVANIRPVKGIEVLLNAISIVRKEIPQVLVQIVGDNDHTYFEKIKTIVDDKGLDVEFLGKTDNVLPIVAKFDIAVNTSFSEGFSNAVLEYMALGKPVILSSVGGNPEAIIDGESGFLFESGDYLNLSEKIKILFKDRVLRAKIGQNAKNRCKEYFNEERMVGRYIDIFRNQ